MDGARGQADPIVRAFKAAKQAPATQSAPVRHLRLLRTTRLRN